MRLLISNTSSFFMSREAVLLARNLGAEWATPPDLYLWGDPGHWAENKSETLIEREEAVVLPYQVPRHDAILLEVFDQIGGRRMGIENGSIVSVEVPDDLFYSVESYVYESIVERHRRWDAQGGPFVTYPVFSKSSFFEKKS